jgi:hypothetical protein
MICEPLPFEFVAQWIITNPLGSPELKLDERFGLMLTVERKPDSEPTDWVTAPYRRGPVPQFSNECSHRCSSGECQCPKVVNLMGKC